MSYSDLQRHQNYQILVSAIRTIDQGINEDWVEIHKHRIIMYRDWIYDYSIINPEVTDKDFRRVAYETELILASLMEQIRTERTFNVQLYLSLNQHMIRMIEFFMEEDELEEMLSRMTV